VRRGSAQGVGRCPRLAENERALGVGEVDTNVRGCLPRLGASRTGGRRVHERDGDRGHGRERVR
jgi:hypothetical protein